MKLRSRKVSGFMRLQLSQYPRLQLICETKPRGRTAYSLGQHVGKPGAARYLITTTFVSLIVFGKMLVRDCDLAVVGEFDCTARGEGGAGDRSYRPRKSYCLSSVIYSSDLLCTARVTASFTLLQGTTHLSCTFNAPPVLTPKRAPFSTFITSIISC